MQTFTIAFGRVWWARAFGRSALVRTTDRVEAWILMVAVVGVVLATPIAGAIGTSVQDARARLHAEQVRTAQQVTATATEAGSRHVLLDDVSYSVTASWIAAGGEHLDVIDWPTLAKPGDQQIIWVNTQGDHIKPPPGRSRAAADAVAVALSVWLGVAASATAFVYMARLVLDRRRYSDWDREVYADHDEPKNHN